MSKHTAALYVDKPSDDQFRTEGDPAPTRDEEQYQNAVALRKRHQEETNQLIAFFAREQADLLEAQSQRQERCPVCDYRSLNHQERLILNRADQLLRSAHTAVIREEKKYFYEFGRMPNKKNYWDYLSYDEESFQRALLGHAHQLEEAEMGGGSETQFERMQIVHDDQLALLEKSLEVQKEAHQIHAMKKVSGGN